MLIFEHLQKTLNTTATSSDIELTLATNSVKIQFFEPATHKNVGYLWIDPAWRIIKNNRHVLNSYNYPYHQNYSEDEKTKEKEDLLA